MTLSEFRAWFDGFTEDMAGPPNAKQWKRIQSRVKEITGAAVSYPVYIDRYVRPHWDRPYWATYGNVGAVGAVSQSAGSLASGSASPRNDAAIHGARQTHFNSHKAMNDLGRLDAVALAS
jgi:hypothetical protein